VRRPERTAVIPGAIEDRVEGSVDRRLLRPERPAVGLVERAKGELPMLRRRLEECRRISAVNQAATNLWSNRRRRGITKFVVESEAEAIPDQITVLVSEIEAIEELIAQGVPSWEEIDGGTVVIRERSATKHRERNRRYEAKRKAQRWEELRQKRREAM
jgi:hypothetical protein